MAARRSGAAACDALSAALTSRVGPPVSHRRGVSERKACFLTPRRASCHVGPELLIKSTDGRMWLCDWQQCRNSIPIPILIPILFSIPIPFPIAISIVVT